MYEDDDEAEEMLNRLRDAGLGALPKLMIGVEAELVQPIPVAGDPAAANCASKPAKVA